MNTWNLAHPATTAAYNSKKLSDSKAIDYNNYMPMNLIRFLLVPVAIFLWLGCFIMAEDTVPPDKCTTFGEGEERERFSNCFVISYPDSFIIDPTSGISFSRTIGRDAPIPEENLHTLVLHNEKESLEVRASTCGFLTKEFYVPRGFESPREVILTDFFRNALTTKIIRTQYYDLFYSETDKEVFALYLNRIKGWNANYQTLLFLFKNGITFKDHAKMVEKIMKKFIPSFARQD